MFLNGSSNTILDQPSFDFSLMCQTQTLNAVSYATGIRLDHCNTTTATESIRHSLAAKHKLAQLNTTQHWSTQHKTAQLNTTKLNSTQYNSTQLMVTAARHIYIGPYRKVSGCAFFSCNNKNFKRIIKEKTL